MPKPPDGFFKRPFWDEYDELAQQTNPPIEIEIVKTIETRRTREHFEEAMKNADCPLFEAIARWVIQDEGYKSMGDLVRRIKQLEATERNFGIVSTFNPF